MNSAHCRGMAEPFKYCVKRTCLLIMEIWSGHEKLRDKQMDGQTDDQCLDIMLAIPTSNALPICIIYFFDLLINAGNYIRTCSELPNIYG